MSGIFASGSSVTVPRRDVPLTRLPGHFRRRSTGRVLADLPAFAAWRFLGAVEGFEVVYTDGRRLRGHASAVEEGRAYAVRYEIELDHAWRTRYVHVESDTTAGPRRTVLRSDGEGSWTVDGVAAPHLAGLVDVDLEASACTNTLPVHRLDLSVGAAVAAPAVYVRALDLTVSRLEQTYRRRPDGRFDYTSEHGDFRAVLTYDDAGLVLDYPGIAVRSA